MSNHHPIKSIAKGLLLFALLVVAVLFCFFYFFQKAFCLDLGNGVKLEVVKTPDNIWWGKYEVTQEQWMAIIRRRPSGCERQMGPDKPVLLARDSEVDEFLNKLNALPSVKLRGLVFRLPTRGEWETACLAGSRGKWPLVAGGREGTLDELAWYDGDLDESHPVGMKTPNAYGLYDMLGNVSERTTTKAFAPSYFPEIPPELENWYAGGDMSFERADFLAGGRTGLARNYAYSFAGFRICAPARGYSAPVEEPVVQEDQSTGPVDSVAVDDTPTKVSPPVPHPSPQPAPPSALSNRTPGTLDSQREMGNPVEMPTKPNPARADQAEGTRVDNHPTVVSPPVPMAPAEMTPESIMELAKKQAAQKVAEGDWEGAQKILENARAMAESLEATQKKAEEARLAQDAAEKTRHEKNVAQKSRENALEARKQADRCVIDGAFWESFRSEIGVPVVERWDIMKGQVEATFRNRAAEVKDIDDAQNLVGLYLLRCILTFGFDSYQKGLIKLETAEKAFRDGKYEAAERLWTTAMTDFTQAVTIFTDFIEHAESAERTDTERLLKWLFSQSAAVQDDGWGALMLGLSLVDEDNAEAMKWFRKAAEQGHTWGQVMLGLMLEAKDDAEAMKWFRKAAERGNAWGQYMLGVKIFSTSSITYPPDPGAMQSISEAIKWLKRAEEQGFVLPQDQGDLGNLIQELQKLQKILQDDMKKMDNEENGQDRRLIIVSPGQGRNSR